MIQREAEAEIRLLAKCHPCLPASCAQASRQAHEVNKTLSVNQIIRPTEELVSLYCSCAKLKTK